MHHAKSYAMSARDLQLLVSFSSDWHLIYNKSTTGYQFLLSITLNYISSIQKTLINFFLINNQINSWENPWSIPNKHPLSDPTHWPLAWPFPPAACLFGPCLSVWWSLTPPGDDWIFPHSPSLISPVLLAYSDIACYFLLPGSNIKIYIQFKKKEPESFLHW